MIFLRPKPDPGQSSGNAEGIILPSKPAHNAMNNALPATSQEPVLLTCRTQHQHWATDLAQREADIDQMMSLLTDLPEETYRSLNHHAPAYVQKLHQLKTNIHRLQTEVVCTGLACSSASVVGTICPDPRFAQSGGVSNLITSVSAEYGQLKDRCHRFLGELMRLNLI
jgi:hypothetical protein